MIDIEYIDGSWIQCLRTFYSEGHYGLVTLSVLTLSPFLACALVPTDEELLDGMPCTVVVPSWSSPAMFEHEIRHCECWDHPKRKER